ncbi:ribosome biogenesis protein NOP53-like [Macrobrachium nipponense]|uniref:ribosome biogenesis protein NOP53-like n=1 Tax=Macrobrachium nipponense TaxID=159736 RepID=UPI0030C82A90
MLKVITNKGDQTKRKRYSKNKKKAWRKKTQISDVEEHLEDKRREERYGGPLEEREDQELMFIDVGDESEKKPVVPVTFAVDTKPGNIDGFKPRKRKLPEKPLHCHKYLVGFQGAKTPHKEKTRKDKQNAALKQQQSKSEVRAKRKNLAAREAMRVKHLELPKKRRRMKIGKGMLLDWNSDNWTADNNELVKRCKMNGVEEDFVEQIVDFHSKISGERMFKVPGVRYQKTSALPAVKVAEAGQSYNPTFEDHQVVLEKAIRQQGKQRRIDERYDSATIKMFPTIDKAPTEETWLAEMSEGLPTANDNEEEESDEEEVEQESETTVTGKRTTERKTQKQRKKEFKQKFKERKKVLAKERRIRESNVYRIKTINKEIIENEKILKCRQAARKAYHEQKKSKPLRLGKEKFQAEDIAVSLGTELKGSLRSVKPVCNLLEERFKNLQRRNLIEPRVRVKHLKPKLKKTVMKKDHKALLKQIEKLAEEKMK